MGKNKQSEVLKQEMIDFLKQKGVCPRKPHELKMSTLKLLAISQGYETSTN